jgi:hypothetical protein
LTLLRLDQFGLDHAPSLLQGFHLSFRRSDDPTEAGCWPDLAQLLAETGVELSNNRQLAALDAGVLGEAIDEAVGRGTVVLTELIEGECVAG